MSVTYKVSFQALLLFAITLLAQIEAAGQAQERKNSISKGILYGARLAMATAYQSCDVLSLPAMDKKSPEVQGIEIDGKHPNGQGDRFIISNLSEVLRTHFYWKWPALENENCRQQKEQPLIYDYGGKPWVSNQDSQSLDFFKDAGSGTEVLGIDCSGFVFSSLAAAGWKLSSQQRLEARLVNNYNAKSFKEPQKNGLNCFEKVTAKNPAVLSAGDIIASSYHVAIVDSVGADPFNFSRVTVLRQCETLDADDFNFTLIHSAPYKGGIGISRVLGRDYINDNFFFSLGLISYARASCREWFVQNHPQISGNFAGNDLESKSLLDIVFGPFTNVIRHKQSKECLARPLRLVGQECVETCPQL